MKSNFSIFFSVEILHEYFLDHQCKDFEIVPSADTIALFNKAKILHRNTENRLTALIQENGAYEPFFNNGTTKNYRSDFGKSVFRFYLKIKNPLFFNYTNIPFDFNGQKKFYFSNLSPNNTSGFLFLSAPVALFSVGKQYVPGNLVRDSGSGKVFEALKKLTGVKESELSDPGLWSPKGISNEAVTDFTPGRYYNAGDLVQKPKTDNIFEAAQKTAAGSLKELDDPSLWIPRGQGQLQYAGADDAVEYSGGKYHFNLAQPAKKADISIFDFNYDTVSPAYDVRVNEKESKTFSDPVSVIPLDFTSLRPGKYLVKINDESRAVYYDPQMNTGNVFGVIEIFNFLPGSGDYALLTEDEKIKKTKYEILFAARKVLWKYVRKDGRAKTITDTGATSYQFQLQGDSFVSSLPIPLSENVLKTLTLEFSSSDFKLSPLPNPSPDRFSKCNQNDYDYLCSEMKLNY
jgi:hypothetical protein